MIDAMLLVPDARIKLQEETCHRKRQSMEQAAVEPLGHLGGHATDRCSADNSDFDGKGMEQLHV